MRSFFIVGSSLLPSAVLVLAGSCLSVRAQCLKYSPEVVNLSGRVSSHVFPGPPNYESIRHGDRKETAIILTIASRVCVQGGGDPQLDQPESKVRELQLVIRKAEEWKTVDRRLGKRVTVTGTLFHGFTGHHRTRVLIDVTNIRAAT